VRDRLLGLTPGDRDWVVVGTTPEAMLAAGFKPVGRDFPVFLHPDTGEEHALARTERKSGRGYRGFVVDAAPSVTLEDDPLRRDFTTMPLPRRRMAPGRSVRRRGRLAGARAAPCWPAFVEDPLRVLRAARFMARFAPLGFRIAPETLALMRKMAASGELDALVPERVWQELRKALASARPSAFLRTLHETGALAVVLPEVEALYGVPQRAEYHPEIDTGRHVEMVCDMAARIAPGDAGVGFAALTHDLGKALTPRDEWPRHVMHEQRGVAPLKALCERLKLPVEIRDLAVIACREHLNVHRIAELRDATVLELLERCDGFRKPGRIAALAQVCQADARGRLGFGDSAYPQGTQLCRLHAAALAVNARGLAQQGLSGPQIGQALAKARIAAISAARGPR
jgi:tRNA nucleotidyltransferase (CCA-adding enzyme)